MYPILIIQDLSKSLYFKNIASTQAMTSIATNTQIPWFHSFSNNNHPTMAHTIKKAIKNMDTIAFTVVSCIHVFSISTATSTFLTITHTQ